MTAMFPWSRPDPFANQKPEQSVEQVADEQRELAKLAVAVDSSDRIAAILKTSLGKVAKAVAVAGAKAAALAPGV